MFFFSFLSLTSSLLSPPPPSSVDCTGSPQSSYPFCDPKLPPEDRASDLVSRLTPEELVSQSNARPGAIPRLGIKDYNWRSNCLHGWALSGGKWPPGITWTNFPTPLGKELIFKKIIYINYYFKNNIKYCRYEWEPLENLEFLQKKLIIGKIFYIYRSLSLSLCP